MLTGDKKKKVKRKRLVTSENWYSCVIYEFVLYIKLTLIFKKDGKYDLDHQDEWFQKKL